jgi:hypothetical protein
MAARVTTAGTTHHASRSNLSWWDKLRYQLPARVRLHVVRGLTCTLLPELSLSTTLGLPSVRPHNIDAEVRTTFPMGAWRAHTRLRLACAPHRTWWCTRTVHAWKPRRCTSACAANTSPRLPLLDPARRHQRRRIETTCG